MRQIFYTCSSLYIIFLMTSVYARTREREKAWKFGMYCLIVPIVITPFWYWIFHDVVTGKNTFMKVSSTRKTSLRSLRTRLIMIVARFCGSSLRS